MAKQANNPRTGYFSEENHGEAPHESEDDVQRPKSRPRNPESQFPSVGPAPSAFPQPSKRRKVLSGIFEDQENDQLYQSQHSTRSANRSSQELTLDHHDGFQGFEQEPESENLNDIEESEDWNATKATHVRVNTTFDAPTQSSIAKQSDKVEIPQAIKRISTFDRAPSAQRNSVRRQQSQSGENHGGVNFGHSQSVKSRPEYHRTVSDKQVGEAQRLSPPASSARHFGHRRKRSRSDESRRPLPDMRSQSSRPGSQSPQASSGLDESKHETSPEDHSQDPSMPGALLEGSQDEGPDEDHTPNKLKLDPLALSSDTAPTDDVPLASAAGRRPSKSNLDGLGFDEEHLVVKKVLFNALRDERDDLQKDLQAAQTEFTSLQEELRIARNERDNFERSSKDAHNQIQQLETDLQTFQDEQDKSIEKPQFTLEDFQQLQQQNKTADDSMKALQQQIDTFYLRTSVPSTLEEALDEIKLLRTAGLDVAQAEKDAEDANTEARRIYDDLEKLQKALEFLEICANDASAAMLKGTTRFGSIKAKMQRAGFGSVAEEHVASLLQLFNGFDKALETLNTSNDQLQKDLTKERSLSQYLDEKKKGWSSKIPSTFRDLYEDTLQKCKMLEKELKDAQNTAARAMDQELKMKNAKLKDDLAKYHRRTLVPRLQAGFYQVSARLWENEVKIAKEELDKRTTAFQEASDAQLEEMQLYVEAYHKKSLDESHWNLRDLQSKLVKVESESRRTDVLFNKAKVDNARLEREVEQLQDDDTKKENLIRTLMHGGQVLDLAHDDATSEDGDPSSPKAWLDTPQFTKSVPCYSPQFLLKQEKRKGEMAEFRKEQERRRQEEENGLDDMMEKIRKYRMDVMDVTYPPGKGTDWSTVKKESSWDRWDGEAWWREVKLAPQEKRLIKVLKEKKILVTKEKKSIWG